MPNFLLQTTFKSPTSFHILFQNFFTTGLKGRHYLDRASVITLLEILARIVYFLTVAAISASCIRSPSQLSQTRRLSLHDRKLAVLLYL